MLIVYLLPGSNSLNLAMDNTVLFNLVTLVFLSADVGVTVRPFGVLMNSVMGRGRGTGTCSVRDFLYGTNSMTKCVFPFLFAFLNVGGMTRRNIIPSSMV